MTFDSKLNMTGSRRNSSIPEVQTAMVGQNQESSKSKTIVSVLELQVRQLEEDRDALCLEKAQLMASVDEYRVITDQLAIQVKNADKVHED